MMRQRDPQGGIALAAARCDIARRLRSACTWLTEDEFAALVDRMARVEMKYRLRDEWLTFRSPAGVLAPL